VVNTNKLSQIIVNYASFLEDNHYFEESFKVYERGVELFNFPVSFEVWNIYLSKFIRRYVSTEDLKSSVLLTSYRGVQNSNALEISSSRPSKNAHKSTASPYF
jgi:hypothetical protein